MSHKKYDSIFYHMDIVAVRGSLISIVQKMPEKVFSDEKVFPDDIPEIDMERRRIESIKWNQNGTAVFTLNGVYGTVECLVPYQLMKPKSAEETCNSCITRNFTRVIGQGNDKALVRSEICVKCLHDGMPFPGVFDPETGESMAPVHVIRKNRFKEAIGKFKYKLKKAKQAFDHA